MSRITSIAFYLPQFHITQFNNANWGPGFTEWTNVARGRPLFPGHQQPKIPGELGFYDLRLSTVLGQQIALAQAYGIYGFCFYYYRFGKERDLNLPVDNLLSKPQPNLPFCYCWANEDWTRAWDGRSDEVIRRQDYGSSATSYLIDDLARAFSDERYIRVKGKPLFLIYQVELIPEVAEWLDNFRRELHIATRSSAYIGAVFSHGMNSELAKIVDIVIQFPPHRVPRVARRQLLTQDSVNVFDEERTDFFESYDSVIEASLKGVDFVPNLVPGICPDWDNSPRRPSGAHVLVGSSPADFQRWATEAGRQSLIKAGRNAIPHPLLFVNAWNEWGEGAMLEPTWTHGRAYLEAFHSAVSNL